MDVVCLKGLKASDLYLTHQAPCNTPLLVQVLLVNKAGGCKFKYNALLQTQRRTSCTCSCGVQSLLNVFHCSFCLKRRVMLQCVSAFLNMLLGFAGLLMVDVCVCKTQWVLKFSIRRLTGWLQVRDLLYANADPYSFLCLSEPYPTQIKRISKNQ